MKKRIIFVSILLASQAYCQDHIPGQDYFRGYPQDSQAQQSVRPQGLQISPDGNFRGGPPALSPDGKWIEQGPLTAAPDGSWVGGKPQMGPDGNWIGGGR